LSDDGAAPLLLIVGVFQPDACGEDGEEFPVPCDKPEATVSMRGAEIEARYEAVVGDEWFYAGACFMGTHFG